MIEWFLFLATLVLPLLVARCIGAMGAEDEADHDVWRALGGETSMSEQAIAVIRAILAEVAGHEAPYSADSYLPSHMIHDAREVIEQHERCHEQAIARRQQEVRT